VQTLGVKETANRLELTIESVLRVAAGAPVRKGTLAAVALNAGKLTHNP
jgi:hypothetical protein